MSTPNTSEQYHTIVRYCRGLFEKKTADYGTSWRILRLSSLTDQIYIKASRIRSLQEKGVQMITDDIPSEFVGIINYCVMALIQEDMAQNPKLELPLQEALDRYDAAIDNTYKLMMAKNHDYGEAWRLMRVSSITDIILMRLLRIKQIEDNQGTTLVSEGVGANYQDIINYAIFALILSNFQSHAS